MKSIENKALIEDNVGKLIAARINNKSPPYHVKLWIVGVLHKLDPSNKKEAILRRPNIFGESELKKTYEQIKSEGLSSVLRKKYGRHINNARVEYFGFIPDGMSYSLKVIEESFLLQ